MSLPTDAPAMPSIAPVLAASLSELLPGQPAPGPVSAGTDGAADVPPGTTALLVGLTGAYEADLVLAVWDDVAAVLDPTGGDSTALEQIVGQAASALGCTVARCESLPAEVALASASGAERQVLSDIGGPVGLLAVTVRSASVPAPRAPEPEPVPAPAPAPSPYEALAPQGASVAAAMGLSAPGRLELLQEVELDVSAELGRARMTLRELLGLSPGNVVELDRLAGSPVDLLVNGMLIARGEVVVVDELFGVRISELNLDAGDTAGR